MGEVKVLHMADMHLDWPFSGMGADGLRSRMRREELKEVFAGIIDLCLRERADVLLIAGDLFEGASAGRGLIQFVDRQLQRLSGCRVFISPGNHDPYLEGSYYQTYPWAPNVHIFTPEPERVAFVTGSGVPVEVIGWGFGAWEAPAWQGPAREAGAGGGATGTGGTGPRADLVRLALLHGGEGRYQPFAAADLAALQADYIALGHIHKEGVLLQQGGRVVARYSGSPEALSFGEPGQHGVFLGLVGPGSGRMEFVPTGRRQYITLEVDVTGAASLEDLTAACARADSLSRRQQHCFRLVVTGAVDRELTVDLPVLQEKLAEEFYFLKLEDATRPDFDLQRLAEEKSARGLFVQRLMAMEAAAPDEAARERVRRALALGLNAFEGRGAGR